MQDIYKVKTRPLAACENIIQGEKYRITLLTEGLVRLEYSEEGIFEDRATQFAFYRDFPKTNFRVLRTPDGIEIHTSRLHLVYNEKDFSSFGLSIQVKGNLSVYHSIWKYGEKSIASFLPQLKGTARTLDMADGEIPLEDGIISAAGYSLIDDSRSQILLENGWIEPRRKNVQDLYFFGYGHDYKEALKDFYYLSGNTPMLPRYALGNWWSRYYKYTEDSYMNLMERFDKENLPFTVAVIDMDWHLVDIDPKYGSGWTGYTWNKDFFPDPKRFLTKLHERGMHTTLNVHPAGGVAGHEEMYLDMAKEMGVDYEHEDPVLCDPASPEFLEAYFKYLHHPREEEGVDFWWIDWQQGSSCKIEGLDPLWIFNHYHFLDNKRSGKRPMTFSRYAGPGSHRYPIGFSGDTWITWDSLDFQPYFTSSASNIGYGWWSHDIGGHMGGIKDDEMATRWIQSGLYSPIMRLHSSNSEFNGKEPWRYKKESELVMGNVLRERHKMLPYLYTMNYRAYKDASPLVQPMYYDYPEEQSAYKVKNQFMFGSELMVASITSKRIPGMNVSEIKVWIPEGLWYDLHTGVMYDGNRMLFMYRDINSVPVLAKAGAILPFTDEISGLQATKNPSTLRLKVYAGANGSFEMYEDDNETCGYEDGDCVTTQFTYTEADKAEFIICSAQGNLSLIPAARSYTVELTGFSNASTEQITATANGETIPISLSYDEKKQAVIVILPEIDVTKEIKIIIDKKLRSSKNNVLKNCFDFLNQAEMDFFLKDDIYSIIEKENRTPVLLAQLQTMNLGDKLLNILTELITAISF
ncbi:MAG: glycoside hydrolase family 31 protein [Schaedlerella sp.]|nr:glycoside hydrolase family 31 protein [Schaedlerella sp.]